MKNVLIEIVGWYGTFAILGAYTLSSFGIISPQNLVYQLLNLTGAAGIISISVYKKAWQPAVLNIVWSIIALIALIGIIL